MIRTRARPLLRCASEAPLETGLARVRTYVIAGILSSTTIATVGCAGDSTSVTPSPPVQAPAPPVPPPPPPPPPSPSVMISGIVIEYTASDEHHPTAGVLLSVITAEGETTTTSDTSGRFSAEVRGDVVTIVPAATSPYLSPCPGGGVPNPNQTFKVNIVSKDVLTTTGMPGSYPLWIYVSGTVSERGSDGSHPLAGASVSLMGWWGEDSGPGYSTTLSDALGRYTLCTAPPGVGTDQTLPLRATKQGYFADSLSVLGGWTNPWYVWAFGDTLARTDSGGVNIELVRRP